MRDRGDGYRNRNVRSNHFERQFSSDHCTLAAAKFADLGRDLSSCSWFPCLGKLLQSIKLLLEHVFYKRRDLLESAINESTDAIRELEAGVVGAACQLPSQGSSDTRRLQRSERS